MKIPGFCSENPKSQKKDTPYLQEVMVVDVELVNEGDRGARCWGHLTCTSICRLPPKSPATDSRTVIQNCIKMFMFSWCDLILWSNQSLHKITILVVELTIQCIKQDIRYRVTMLMYTMDKCTLGQPHFGGWMRAQYQTRYQLLKLTFNHANRFCIKTIDSVQAPPPCSKNHSNTLTVEACARNFFICFKSLGT